MTVFYENVDACGNYIKGTKGAPGSANYPYYISHDGNLSALIPCPDGTHTYGFKFEYRKGSSTATPFLTGTLSTLSLTPSASIEVVNAPIGTDYIGCQASGGVCFDPSYGLHLLNTSYSWSLWTSSALAFHDDPPYQHVYNNYWSFATCPVSC